MTNVGTLEMLSATYAALKRLGGDRSGDGGEPAGGSPKPKVEVLLMNLSRGVEQLESLRFEAINPTVLLRVEKAGNA